MEKKNYLPEFYMIETEERLETIQLLDEAKAICLLPDEPIDPDLPSLTI